MTEALGRQARPRPAEEYGLAALNRALDGVDGVTAVHICFGLRGHHPREGQRLFVPEPIEGLPLQADPDRDGAVEPRLRGAKGSSGREDHSRRARSLDGRDRDPGARSRSRRATSSGLGGGGGDAAFVGAGDGGGTNGCGGAAGFSALGSTAVMRRPPLSEPL